MREVERAAQAADNQRDAERTLEHRISSDLRPLARALDTSPRMLLYDFGSKDRLVHEILAEIRRRERSMLDADVHTLDEVWRWISAPERTPFLRLFFETYVAALGRDEAQPFVLDWLAYLEEHWT